MQTDELRAELAQLAREVEPFNGDLPGVRRRVARRRVAAASIAIVLVAAVTAGVVAATAGGTRRVEVAHSVKEVELDRLGAFDAVVVLPTAAGPDDTEQVAATLAGSAAVAQFAPLPPAQLVEAIRFSTDGRSLADRACGEPAILSFGVRLAAGNSEATLARDVGAEATIAPVDARATDDAEVFMQVKATPAETDAVHAALDQDPDVVRATYVTHQDAFNEFKRLFADQPRLIQSEAPDGSGLPESFQLVLREGASTSGLTTRYDQLSGVDQVITPNRTASLAQACAFLQMGAGRTGVSTPG
jgi:hypothetical protein